MRRRAMLAIDALIAIVLVSAGLFIAVNSAGTIITNASGKEAQLIYLHSRLEKAMGTCAMQGGLAECNENYYFYGVIDSAAQEKIGSGSLCVSRLAARGEKVVKIIACGD